MCGKHQQIRVVMELADSTIPLDSDAIADALARELQCDVVTRWSDQVQEAIACAKRVPNALIPVQDDSDSQKKAEIQARIALLEKELLELRNDNYEHR